MAGALKSESYMGRDLLKIIHGIYTCTESKKAFERKKISIWKKDEGDEDEGKHHHTVIGHHSINTVREGV